MINVTQQGWAWDILDAPGFTPDPEVWHGPSERISALLGPDGEPLRVAFERPKLGFDLTPKG